MYNHRPHPHIAIPYDPHPPPPNPDPYRSSALELGSASKGLLDPWDTATPTARQSANRFGIPPHTRPRTRSAVEPVPPNLHLQVSEPQIHRSASQRQTAHEHYHRSSRSDSGYSFGEEYSSRSGLTSPFSPSVNLPGDEVGISFAGIRSSSLILVVDGLQARLVDSRVV